MHRKRSVSACKSIAYLVGTTGCCEESGGLVSKQADCLLDAFKCLHESGIKTGTDICTQFNAPESWRQ